MKNEDRTIIVEYPELCIEEVLLGGLMKKGEIRQTMTEGKRSQQNR
jgi:hypothetical protein